MKFTKAQITYHWLTFAIILVMASTGLAYSYELVGSDAMVVHQIAGQILIAVIALRLIARVTNTSHAEGPPQAEWERRAAQLVHLALYLCLIAYVVTGYVSASGETDNALLAPVSLAFARSDMGEMFLDTHYNLKWVLLGLFGVHFLAAMKHHFWNKDTTLTQMTFNGRKG